MDTETLEQVLARHRKELKDLQGRITNKKKNASKKTRKGINDECADMERQLRDQQTVELAFFHGETTHEAREEEEEKEDDKGPDVDADALREAQAALPPGAGGDEGKKKKKNRQKERLARRAAEQEDAMQRAHDEAANMTDHRARESEYMKRMFETHGLVEKDINPDGHCLFSAVADQLDQLHIPLDAAAAPADAPRDLAYKVVRRTAVEYMVAHPDDFAPFLEEDLAAYASRMRDTAEWGGQLELTALARRYGVEIRVIQDGRTEKIGEEQQQQQQGRTLWLAYYRHGYGLGEHYNSLRKVTTTATTTTQTTKAAATAG